MGFGHQWNLVELAMVFWSWELSTNGQSLRGIRDLCYLLLELKAFARETSAGRDRIIVLTLDNAGWHGPENLPVPDGIRLLYRPSYSPELQPAEHLWPLVDEPLVNKHFDTIDDLDAAVAKRIEELGAGLSQTEQPSPDKGNRKGTGTDQDCHFFLRTISLAAKVLAEPQNALQMCEQHLNPLPVTA